MFLITGRAGSKARVEEESMAVLGWGANDRLGGRKEEVQRHSLRTMKNHLPEAKAYFSKWRKTAVCVKE